MGYIIAFMFGFSGNKLFLKKKDNIHSSLIGVSSLLIYIIIFKCL
jgi:hypothetical protein